jgi:hypothetical protein
MGDNKLHDNTKLPKWAQTYIANLRREVSEANDRIADLKSDHQGSNVRICEYTQDDICLPPFSEVDFYPYGHSEWVPGEYAGRRPSKISVMISRGPERKGTIQICGDESIAVEPVSSNLIRVRMT